MRRIGFGLIPAATLWLSGCGHPPEATHAQSKKEPVAVHVQAAASLDQPSFYEASGTVRAQTAAQVSSRVMAYVREVRAKVGDRVREGQVLAVLDSRDADVRKRQAEAGREEAKGAAAEAEQGYVSAKANLELAEVTFSRMKDLYDKTSISRQEFDEVSARMKMARAGLEMAAARKAQVGAKIQHAEEETNSATILQGYSTLTAPFSGVVTAKSVEPGNLAVPGAPLLTIERTGGFWLEANVQESALASIRLGQTVHVEVEALGREVAGRVTEIVPEVDPSARSAIVKIDLPGVADLRTGLFGRARFPSGSKRALIVTTSAMSERGQVQWVFVADNGFARSRIVTAGERRGSQVEILSGLAGGDRLITPVPPGLSDGDPVEVKP